MLPFCQDFRISSSQPHETTHMCVIRIEVPILVQKKLLIRQKYCLIGLIRGIQVKKPSVFKNPPLLFPDLAGGRNFFERFSLKRSKIRVLGK